MAKWGWKTRCFRAQNQCFKSALRATFTSQKDLDTGKPPSYIAIRQHTELARGKDPKMAQKQKFRTEYLPSGCSGRTPAGHQGDKCGFSKSGTRFQWDYSTQSPCAKQMGPKPSRMQAAACRPKEKEKKTPINVVPSKNKKQNGHPRRSPLSTSLSQVESSLTEARARAAASCSSPWPEAEVHQNRPVCIRAFILKKEVFMIHLHTYTYRERERERIQKMVFTYILLTYT